jgi:hypothetical protein
MSNKPTKPRLVIRQGMIKMEAYGQFSEYYLSQWQKKHGIKDGSRVLILTESHFLDLTSRANMAGIA